MIKLISVMGLVCSVGAQYDYNELVPMSEYDRDFRTLSCWECFEARGKMCHDTDHSSMFQITGSSNRGHGVCCKPNFKGTHCGPSDTQHTCSEPTEPEDDQSKEIATGGLNYQLFAFCPMVSQATCGISDSSSYDMSMHAVRQIKTLSTDQLKYREGRPEYRHYDACYYEITAPRASEMMD